jgi:hypothetical protein
MHSKWFVFVIAGVIFFVLGAIGLWWGYREEKRIFDALSQKHDLREFSQRRSDGPQSGALKTGGWLLLALGLLLAVAGIIFWQTGWFSG